MSTNDQNSVCDICGRGKVVRALREIAFHQWTHKGPISLRVTIPTGICQVCGARHWDEAAEAVIEEAVKRETDKLP